MQRPRAGPLVTNLTQRFICIQSLNSALSTVLNLPGWREGGRHKSVGDG